VVSSFGIRKIKVVSEEARPSLSSYIRRSKRHSNCIIMVAVSQNGGCIHWHWPLEDGKK